MFCFSTFMFVSFCYLFFSVARRCYQEALERQPGDHMINPRVHHSVSETLEAMGGYTDALKHERLSHAG